MNQNTEGVTPDDHARFVMLDQGTAKKLTEDIDLSS
jgi:hypothetical protein